jgi:hypothetical protein
MVGTIAFVAFVIVAGRSLWAVLSPPVPSSSLEAWAVGFGLGAGAIAVFVLDLSLLGIPPSPLTIGLFTLVIVALGMVAHHYSGKHGRESTVQWPSTLEGLLLLLLIVPALLVFAHSLSFPVGLAFPRAEWDAFAIWLFKAKVMLEEPVGSSYYFKDLTKSYSHLDYPLLVPSLVSSTWSFVGKANEYAGRGVLSLFYLGIMGVLYSGFRAYLPRTAAVAFVCLIAWIPTLVKHASVGTADVPFTFFVACAGLSLIRWTEDGHVARLVHTGLFSAFALLTKQEGIALALALGAGLLIVALTKRDRKHVLGIGLYVLIIIAVAGPWFDFRAELPRSHEDYGGRLSLSNIGGNLDRLHLVLTAAGRMMIDFSEWGSAWLVIGSIILLRWRSAIEAKTLAIWMVLSVQACSYATAYIISPWDPENLIPITMNRLGLHLFPLLALLASRQATGLRLLQAR